MSVIKIDLDKPYQEFEIAGKVYEVFYDDDSLRKYEKQVKKFHEEATINVDLEKASDEDKEQVEKQQYEVLKATIEVFFGEGSFDDIYKASGKSLINLTKVVTVLFDWLNGKMGALNEQARKYYTK